jgi:CRISPR-associated protein Cas1
VLTGEGCFLRLENGRLLAGSKSEGKKRRFAAGQLPFDLVVAEGNSGFLTFEAARFLSYHDVPVAFLRWDGSLYATVLPRGPVAGKLKVAQLRAFDRTEERTRIARAVLKAKLEKSTELLRFLSRFYSCSPGPVEAVLKRSSRGATVRDLLGREGIVAVAYWREFAKVAERLWPEANFKVRAGGTSKHAQNATDPVNALLNLGYALLEAKVRHAVNSAGLLPEVGFLHEPGQGKLPLVYDLMEGFRWLVDLSVVEVLAGRALDREGGFILTSGYHVRLRPATIGLLAERLGENLGRTVAKGGRTRSFDALLAESTRSLVGYLLGTSRKLDPGVPFAAENAAVDAKAAQEIAALSYADARALGLSKAGLWDVKRRVAEGRPLKLYRTTREKLAA